MSSPTTLLPSPPPRARVKNTEANLVRTTGSQLRQPNESKLLKRRKREDVMQTVSPKSPEPEKSPVEADDSILAHFQKEAGKDSSCCVFLLWGSKDSETSSTWAVDVPITNLESEEDKVFKLLRKTYSKKLGFRRRYFSFRKLSKVVPVTFRLIYRTSDKFLVSMNTLDLEKYRKINKEKGEKLLESVKLIAEYDHEGHPEACELISPWEYAHVELCPVISGSDDDRTVISGLGVDCPVEQMDMYSGRVRWIESASFLSFYYRYPEAARGQNILKGFGDHSFIHYYRGIDGLPLKFQEQSRYLQLDGLYIETAWDPVKPLFIFLALLIPVVVASKIFWGSWEVTFGAGSFFVALPMLALALLSYYEE